MIRARSGRARSGWIGWGSAAGVVLALGACTYHNVLYNAQRLYDQGEALRRVGDVPGSATYYEEVVLKTGHAVRARPESEWAPGALSLLGKSRFRLGDFRGAGAAFEEVVRRTDDAALEAEAGVYMASVRAASGDSRGALEEVNRLLEGGLADETLAQAHLLRGRLLLESGYSDEGWWDLDQASAIDTRLREEAGLERLRVSVQIDDRERSRWAVEALFSHREGGYRADSIASLALLARDHWGAADAAALLEGVDEAEWDRDVRGGLALQRAQLLDEAGHRDAALAQADRVAAGLGTAAAEARLVLASWQVERAADLSEVYDVRRVLLPAGADPRVADRLSTVDELEAYAGLGLDEPLGWFAAAEIARDRLGADYVARGLFLAYADGAPTEPWAPKALLAALDISPDATDRAWLRGRLEAHVDSPYVLAARGGMAVGIEALEEELDLRLRALTPR